MGHKVEPALLLVLQLVREAAGDVREVVPTAGDVGLATAVWLSV